MGEYVPTEWVEGEELLEILEPYTTRRPSRRGKPEYTVNGRVLHSHDRFRERLYELETKRRRKVKKALAEELLAYVDLPPQLVS